MTDNRSAEKLGKWVWMEEYRGCSCSFIAKRKVNLLGYCQRHANSRRRATKLPADAFTIEDLGYAGTG